MTTDDRPTTPIARRVPAQREIGLDRVRRPDEAVRVISAGVGLARLTLGASWRIGGWALGASFRVGNRVLKAAVEGETASTLLENASDEIRDQARDLLGIVDGTTGRVIGYRSDGPVGRRQQALPSKAGEAELRAKGAALLQASADVTYDEPFHPAFSRILDDLAPDEARIIRLLAEEGPQPVIDVRTGGALSATTVVAKELSMVGAEAGCRFMDRVPSYLGNLRRLGLIWISPSEVGHDRYEVLEAQPDAQAAINSASRAKTLRRSLELTPFGTEFATTCLPVG